MCLTPAGAQDIRQTAAMEQQIFGGAPCCNRLRSGLRCERRAARIHLGTAGASAGNITGTLPSQRCPAAFGCIALCSDRLATAHHGLPQPAAATVLHPPPWGHQTLLPASQIYQLVSWCNGRLKSARDL